MPGRGKGSGRGFSGGRGMGGGGRSGSGGGMGAAGRCVCPKCGTAFPHRQGIPCMEDRCPDCGVALLREGSPHHQEVLQRSARSEKDTT